MKTPNSTPTIDLHGFTKETAIRRLTDFLNHHRTSRAVCVITGSGSHSSVGPILRNAVQKLLTRRQMAFQRNSPGSFIVDATSGFEFHAVHQVECTKVILCDAQDELVRLPRQNETTNASYPALSGHTPSETSPPPSVVVPPGPSVQEVATEEANLALAKQASLQDLRGLRTIQRNEKSLMERALRQSEREQQRWNQVEQQEEAMIRQALEASSREMTKYSDDDDLLRILRESAQGNGTVSEEDLVQQALALSLQETTDRTDFGRGDQSSSLL